MCITAGIGAIIGAGIAYVPQVAANINRDGWSFQALTTDIDMGAVGRGALTGGLVGATAFVAAPIAVAAAGEVIAGVGVAVGSTEVLAAGLGASALAGEMSNAIEGAPLFGTPPTGRYPDPATGRGYGVNNPSVRIAGQWSDEDLADGLSGRPPQGLGSPDLHHAGQMPGSGIHEILPAEHRGNVFLHPNRFNQGVTDQVRIQDRQLHWWYRAQQEGAWDRCPEAIYD